MPKPLRLWLYALVLTAVFLRLPGVFANSFHGDEALFATWSRLITVWRDPLLQSQAVDKPPLLFYVQAIPITFLGPFEWAVRLPNWAASIVLIPLTGRWVWRVYGDETAVLAATFLTLTPITIQFSATAFTDPLLTTLLLASLLNLTPAMALQTTTPLSVRRLGWSGLFFGLAVLTKHQAWLFLPLMVALALLGRQRRTTILYWLMGVTPFLLGLWLWALARMGSFGLWGQQMRNFGGVRLIWSWELLPRGEAWAVLWQLSVGTWGLLVVLCVGVVWCAIRPFFVLDKRGVWQGVLAGYVVGYLLFHWLTAVPVWDRYLLPLMPLTALLVAHVIVALFSKRMRVWWWAAVLLIVLMIPGAMAGRNGRLPLGGYPTADQGVADVATFFAEAPYGTVLYDHWYSWQWRYHLFDKRVFVSWFPHPSALAEDLQIFGRDGAQRYVALPNSAVAMPVMRAIEAADFTLEVVAEEGNIILYEIVP